MLHVRNAASMATLSDIAGESESCYANAGRLLRHDRADRGHLRPAVRASWVASRGQGVARACRTLIP
jgi:hypothetical protein